MPIFVFQNSRGHTREALLPTAQQHIYAEGEVWDRVIATPFAFTGQAPKPSMGQEVLNGYREQEIACGSRFHSRLHHETVKRAWKNDASHEQ